jgi:hypothetical protein
MSLTSKYSRHGYMPRDASTFNRQILSVKARCRRHNITYPANVWRDGGPVGQDCPECARERQQTR